MMKATTYKAAVYRGIGKVDIVDLDYPACGDDDIIVRNLLTGVCGSDVSAFYHGGDDTMIWRDHEFGHEANSEVVEIGNYVERLKVGDHGFPNYEKTRRDASRMATAGGCDNLPAELAMGADTSRAQKVCISF